MCIEGTILTIPEDLEVFDTDSLKKHSMHSKVKICQTITKVIIAKNLKKIRSYNGNPDPFNEYTNLQWIEVSSENKFLCSINGVLFTKDGTCLITFPDQHSETYIVPDSVKKISSSAFDYSSKLKNITLGKNIEIIEQTAFFHCSKLTKIVLPSGVKSIGPGTFSYCINLNELQLPSSIEEFGHSLFYECPNLHIVIITETTSRCRFITYDNTIFDTRDDSLVRVPPGYLKPIYEIANFTKKIHDYAFFLCINLEEIHIPASVVEITGKTFSMCTGLKRFVVDNQNRNFCDIDGILFTKDKTCLISYPGSRFGTYTIPSHVRKLGDFCFFSVLLPKKNLTVKFPDGQKITEGFSVYNPKNESNEKE